MKNKKLSKKTEEKKELKIKTDAVVNSGKTFFRLLRKFFAWIFRVLKLSPMSLAGRCRLEFGAAVLFILAVALIIPYIWMNQLTRQTAFNAAKAKTEILQQKHFQLKSTTESRPPLNTAGNLADPNTNSINWIRFSQDIESDIKKLPENQQQMLAYLKSHENISENLWLHKKSRPWTSTYAKIIRANDNCISCHNTQGSAGTFSPGQLIGAVFIPADAEDLRTTVVMNRIWLIIAGILASAGAVIAFYIIAQRVILRPIRQLRALANNVAEGNLSVRSAIRTRDEYQKLSDAFNHMLDGLQGSQEKLRQANRQLDAKIAELSDRNIELFKANKLKSEFLANISHEFRTPLNAILGFAEIIREKPKAMDEEKNRRYAENIITSGRTLLNMINDLLDMAKSEAGKMQLHIDSADINELCKGMIAFFSPLTDKKKIKVKLSVAKNIPTVSTDVTKVQQILYNFLSNAIKFTDEKGKIEVKASMPDEKIVRIAVSDNGCGIAEVDQEKIFEKFRQADGSLTRNTDGTGLGLAISKELASMLAGNVSLESTQGKGSTFSLDIPIILQQPAATQQTDQPENPV